MTVFYPKIRHFSKTTLYGRQVMTEVKEVCEPWKGQCKGDWILTKLNSGTRFFIKMQIFTFGMQLRNTCGQTVKCNLIGWLNQMGQLANFDFDCEDDEEGREQLKEEMRKKREEKEHERLIESVETEVGSKASIGQIINVMDKMDNFHVTMPKHDL